MEEIKPKSQLLSFKACLWATATILSRTLHIPWDEAVCLCPVDDLFNYDAPGREASDPEDTEILSSNSSFTSGENSLMLDAEELHSPFQRLTDGGFEENVSSYCFYAREITSKESSSWPKESLYICRGGKQSFALLPVFRLWATPKNKRKSVGHLVYSGSQLSVDNEIVVMKWLSKACDSALKSLPTSIDDDTILLNAMDNSQDFCRFIEITKLLSCRDVIYAFLQLNNLQDGHGLTDKHVSRKARRFMDKWKLAVQWRFMYKKTLLNCISCCNEILESLLT